jgi:hypothetical protein
LREINMGADNWTICPNCIRKIEDAKAKLIEKANKAYGKVKPEEYLTMLKSTETEVELDRTFREDYDIGTTGDGHFQVNYRSSCTECSFSYKYKIEKDVFEEA